MNSNTNWGNKANRFMKDYQEKISVIQPLLMSSIEKIDGITSTLIINPYQHVNEFEDIRIILFKGVRNQMAALNLKYSFALSRWLSKEWWLSMGSDIENDEEQAKYVLITIRDLMHTDIVAFIQLTFANFDHAIRTIMRGWNKDYWTGSFINITTELFHNIISNISRSESDEYLNAFKMFGHIRNTIHNNGIHYNEDFADVQLSYKDLKLHFQNKQPVNFTFNDLTEIINGCIDGMKEVVTDNTIVSLDKKKMKDITQKFVDILQD